MIEKKEQAKKKKSRLGFFIGRIENFDIIISNN